MHGQESGSEEEWRRDWAQGKPEWTEPEQEAEGELPRVSGALQGAYMKFWVQSPGLEENEIKNQSSCGLQLSPGWPIEHWKERGKGR